MNKKIIAMAAALAMLTALTACGGDASSPAATQPAVTTDAAPAAETTAPAAAADESTPAETGDAVAADAPAAEGVSFSYNANGTEIVISAESDPIVAALGDASDTFEAPSCAFEGTSYTYTYSGFTLETYPDPDDHVTNRVYAVTLTDDTVATKEGAKIGMTSEEVAALCGEPDQETLAFMMYKTDGAALQFFLEDDVVSSIVYTYN